MKRAARVLASLMLGGMAYAGTLKVATFPVRHPVKVAKVAVYPVAHPVKTVKAVSPVQPRW